jgi:hypothetical protein
MTESSARTFFSVFLLQDYDTSNPHGSTKSYFGTYAMWIRLAINLICNIDKKGVQRTNFFVFETESLICLLQELFILLPRATKRG